MSMNKYAGMTPKGVSNFVNNVYDFVGRTIGPGFASFQDWGRHFKRTNRFNKTVKDLGNAEALLEAARKRGATLEELAPYVNDVDQLKSLEKNLAANIHLHNIKSGKRNLKVLGAAGATGATMGAINNLLDDSDKQGRLAALEARKSQAMDRLRLAQAAERRAQESNDLRAEQRTNKIEQQKNSQEAKWLEDTRLLATGGLGLVGGGIGAAVDRRNRLRGFLLGSIIGAGAGGLASLSFDKLTDKPKVTQ